jgi:hypothetical protein
VANTKGSDEDVSNFFNNIVSGLNIRSFVWNASLDYEPDCPPEDEGRKMNIVLGQVLDVTTIISGDLFRGVRIIANIARASRLVWRWSASILRKVLHPYAGLPNATGGGDA